MTPDEPTGPYNPFQCTPTTPWDPSKGEWVTHTGAFEESSSDGYPGGDIARMRCPDCGARWRQEMSQ